MLGLFVPAVAIFGPRSHAGSPSRAMNVQLSEQPAGSKIMGIFLCWSFPAADVSSSWAEHIHARALAHCVTQTLYLCPVSSWPWSFLVHMCMGPIMLSPHRTLDTVCSSLGALEGFAACMSPTHIPQVSYTVAVLDSHTVQL